MPLLVGFGLVNNSLTHSRLHLDHLLSILPKSPSFVLDAVVRQCRDNLKSCGPPLETSCRAPRPFYHGHMAKYTSFKVVEVSWEASEDG